MQGETLQEWQRLCQQAANEQDPERLLELVKRINYLLEQKELRLRNPNPQDASWFFQRRWKYRFSPNRPAHEPSIIWSKPRMRHAPQPDLPALKKQLRELEELEYLSPDDLEILDRMRVLRRRIRQLEKEQGSRGRQAA
jgi:hypothetical protein